MNGVFVYVLLAVAALVWDFTKNPFWLALGAAMGFGLCAETIKISADRIVSAIRESRRG